MTRSFERFERVGKRVLGEPRVTVQRRGALTFNAAAYDSIGRPPAIGLLYSRDTQEIGLIAAPQDDRNAYEVRKQSKSESFLISCGAFLKSYDISEAPSRRYMASVEEGMLIVDLTQKAEIVDRSKSASSDSSHSLFDDEASDGE